MGLSNSINVGYGFQNRGRKGILGARLFVDGEYGAWQIPYEKESSLSKLHLFTEPGREARKERGKFEFAL